MTEVFRTKSGKVLSDEDVEALADEAERGYDLHSLTPREAADELTREAQAMGLDYQDAPEFTGAILFCPVCCSTVDADRWGLQEHECVSCGTKFSVDLQAQIVAEHSMH